MSAWQSASGTSDEMPPQIQCSPSAVCKASSHASYSPGWLITRGPVPRTFPAARHPSEASGSQMNPPMTEREGLAPGGRSPTRTSHLAAASNCPQGSSGTPLSHPWAQAELTLTPTNSPVWRAAPPTLSLSPGGLPPTQGRRQ